MRKFLLATALLAASSLMAGQARANFVQIVGASDANLEDPGLTGNFTTINGLSPTAYGLVISRFANAGAATGESRSVIEFNLAGLGAGATVQSLTFNFQVASFVTPAASPIGIYGYAGSGTIGLADATTAATLLGTYEPASIGLNPGSITLSTATLQSLLGSSSFLAIRLQATTAYANTSLDSLEQSGSSAGFSPPVSLAVNFTPALVPEPSSLVLMGGMASLGLAFASFRRRATA